MNSSYDLLVEKMKNKELLFHFFMVVIKIIAPNSLATHKKISPRLHILRPTRVVVLLGMSRGVIYYVISVCQLSSNFNQSIEQKTQLN